MSQICDFTDQSINLDAVKAAGLIGIVGYVSDYAGKNLTKANFDTALSLGLSVNLVCEQGNQPALRGLAGGQHDGQIANEQANQLGYDPAATIYYVSEDPNQLSTNDYPTVVKYFQGVRSEGGRPIGAYGGWDLLYYLYGQRLIEKGWCVQTWGLPANPPPWLCLVQLVGAPTHGLPIDVDLVLQPDYGQQPLSTHVPSIGGVKMISNIFSFKEGQIDQMQCSSNTLWHKFSEDNGQTWKSEPVASPSGAPFAVTIPTQEPMISVNNGVVTVSVEDAATNIHHFVQAASGPVNNNWWNKVDVP